jgi:hypothetical protein
VRHAGRMRRLAILLGVIAGAAWLAIGVALPRAGAQSGSPGSSRISVDQGVDFPRDM